MNVINVKVSFKQGICSKTGISLVSGDYNSTKMVFDFDIEEGLKVLEIANKDDELIYVGNIENNEIVLVGEKDGQFFSLFTEEGDYKYEISLYENNSKLTSASDYITVKKEQVIVSDEVVEPYVPLFDTLLENIAEALEQTDNLNIDVNKIDDTTTVTITNKEGITKSAEITDGKDYVISQEDYQEIANVVETDIQPILNNKVDKEQGKGLSTNDYTDEEKTKLASLENYDDTEVKSNIANLQTNKADKSEIPDVSDFITKDVDNLTYYTLATDTGNSIEISINSSTYVMTLNLKNSAGQTISTGSVDLPLESVVVSGTYDSTNKKIVLTLQNGNTIDIPVGDLISGLQSEITTDNKLLSDLVDDTNQTNKFVTSEEKTTWNNKSDFSGNYNDLTNKPDLTSKEDKSNKVTSLSSSSTDEQYPSAKAVYDSQEIQNNTIEQAFNKATGAGTEITLNNTINAKMGIKLKGNTYQFTTTGKNIVNFTNKDYTLTDEYYKQFATGLTITSEMVGQAVSVSYDIVLNNYSGTPTAFYGVLGRSQYAAGMTSEIKSKSNAVTTDKIRVKIENAIIPNNVGEYLTIRPAGFSTPVTVDVSISNFQMEFSTTCTDYEPYTNGASPNPSYPQNVNVVTGNNTIRITNKNLFKYGTTSDYTGVGSTYFEVRSNSLYNLIASGSANYMFKNDKYYGTKFYLTAKYDKGTPRLLIKAYDSNDTQITSSVSGWTYNSYYQAYFKDSETGEFNLSNASYIKFGVAWVGTSQEYGTYTDIMVTNTNDKEYETYKEQVYPLNLGNIELCKIGNYQDYIYKNNDKWYKYGLIGKIVFDGTENWTYVENNQRFTVENIINSVKLPSVRIPIASNYFRYSDTGSADGIGFCYYYTNGDKRSIFLYNYSYTDVTSFKGWLSNNNVELYYPLETPIITEITDTTLISQLDTLESAMSYKSQTNITQTNAEIGFNIDAEAYTNLIDVQLNETSIVSNGIANIPIAQSNKYGVPKINSAYGINANTIGEIWISKAYAADIKTGTNNYKPVVPAEVHTSAFYGLAKASGDTTQASSSNAIGTYTDNAKTKIREMLGIMTLTQAQYDSIAVKNNATIYIIVED